MNLASIISSIWARKWTIVVIVVVAALAALPFSIGGSPTYTTTATVFAPAIPPVPNLPQGLAGPLLSNALSSYLEDGLEADTKAALGDDGNQVQTIVATQSADVTNYTVEAGADSSRVALAAATTASQKIIDKANELSESIIDTLNEQVSSRLGPIEVELAEKQTSLTTAQFNLSQLTAKSQSLNNQENSTQQNLLRAESSGQSTGVYEDQLDDIRAQEANLQPKLKDAQSTVSDLASDVTVLGSQRAALSSFSDQAEAFNIGRRTISRVTDPPGPPTSLNIQQIALIETVAILIGLVVGAAVVLVLETRRGAHHRTVARPATQKSS